MKVQDLTRVMEEIAPLSHAEAWDNVGLLAGDPGQDVAGVMLTIDYTAEVAAEVAREKCDAVISYHPPIFKALKRLGPGSVVFDAIRNGIAIYSPHTALDVTEGGTNDMLADVIGLEERAPLRLVEAKSVQCKLVVFVPENAVEKVSRALFDAGAGRIGNYTACSFRSPGTGTFFGEEGKTNPSVGQSGKLERAEEIRLETVVPMSRITAVVQALAKSHPYEEPAFDLNQLVAPPEGKGMGRIGTLPGTRRRVLIERIKQELNLEQLLVAGPTDGVVTRAAVCAGSCGELLKTAIDGGAQMFLTGEIRHHDALAAAEAGVTVVCTLHSNSERAVLTRLKDRLAEKLPGLPLLLSREDRDPFELR